jgi:hypothetical protein
MARTTKTKVRSPDKLDPVSALLKKLFPGKPFMVVVWSPSRRDRSFVEMITNCDLDETAELLKDCIGHMQKSSDLNKSVPRVGNA